ncbi:hypothetical protein BJ742DRAFT_160176 [Cladochytrium replicatum]|nr:hypothetical protein BJ742DRAFT_160176 [Cladochytrium replicatum]
MSSVDGSNSRRGTQTAVPPKAKTLNVQRELEDAKKRFQKQNNEIIKANAVYATQLRKLEKQRLDSAKQMYALQKSVTQLTCANDTLHDLATTFQRDIIELDFRLYKQKMESVQRMCELLADTTTSIVMIMKPQLELLEARIIPAFRNIVDASLSSELMDEAIDHNQKSLNSKRLSHGKSTSVEPNTLTQLEHDVSIPALVKDAADGIPATIAARENRDKFNLSPSLYIIDERDSENSGSEGDTSPAISKTPCPIGTASNTNIETMKRIPSELRAGTSEKVEAKVVPPSNKVNRKETQGCQLALSSDNPTSEATIMNSSPEKDIWEPGTSTSVQLLSAPRPFQSWQSKKLQTYGGQAKRRQTQLGCENASPAPTPVSKRVEELYEEDKENVDPRSQPHPQSDLRSKKGDKTSGRLNRRGTPMVRKAANEAPSEENVFSSSKTIGSAASIDSEISKSTKRGSSVTRKALASPPPQLLEKIGTMDRSSTQPDGTEDGSRSARRRTAVSYAMPSLRSKLRQGDAHTLPPLDDYLATPGSSRNRQTPRSSRSTGKKPKYADREEDFD